MVGLICQPQNGPSTASPTAGIELDVMRRSIAMLAPGPRRCPREDSLRMLTDLADAQHRLDSLKAVLRRLADD